MKGLNPAVELTNRMKLVGGFEKNNLQIFDELVLLVVKMLSCGDAKKREGGEVIVKFNLRVEGLNSA